MSGSEANLLPDSDISGSSYRVRIIQGRLNLENSGIGTMLRAMLRATPVFPAPCIKTLSPSNCRIRRHYSILNLLPSRKELVPRGSRTQPPPLPPPKYVGIQGHCTLEYVDIQPSGEEPLADKPVTIVMLHGAPGSYQDFRYLIPLVQRPRVRIVGINLPGYAGSTVAKSHYLESISALPTAKLILDALKQLCGGADGDENVFMVGHSFGAHTAINVAALNAAMKSTSQSKASINFRGMALLSPVGCSPHHVMRPRANALVIKMLDSGNPLLVSFASHAVKAIYTKLLRFPTDWPVDPFIAAVVRAGTTDFDLVREQVALLSSLNLPTLIAWSQSDEYIQEEVPLELEQLSYAGPRLAFAGGGHNIQKTRVEPIADAINGWIADVLSNEHVLVNKNTTQFLP
ncbi:hypothetical protein ON010_g4088 [Phytophthora cinnamomi]|nr:hypothetical protein ON010_g4088 [Phytophthora cinnamomi]